MFRVVFAVGVPQTVVGSAGCVRGDLVVLVVGSSSAPVRMMRATVPVIVELGVATPRGTVRVEVGRQGEEAQLGKQLKQTNFVLG